MPLALDLPSDRDMDNLADLVPWGYEGKAEIGAWGTRGVNKDSVTQGSNDEIRADTGAARVGTPLSRPARKRRMAEEEWGADA